MKLVNQYIIHFKGLKEGEHDFDFDIGEAFFEEYLSSVIQSGKVKAEVILIRKNSFLEVEVSLSGVLELQCDRCLDYFKFDLDYSGELLVKFKENIEEPEDDIIYVHPNDEFLDLTQYLIDSIGLSIPLQKVHPENKDGSYGCNQEMLEKIDEHSYKEKHIDGEVDPRWSKLKDLLNKENKN